ncbi:hypothetical protein AVEN_135702-1 [Araneus ventricosus]|uniref:Uncharacterized protein n=1 Tax=Araneus ventricosus TaxID=182803 RepID=A0A4Y2EV80_ARAVE|nr:hypothetical protein AVEN_135702-1 [Araneus ventricosus]
MALRRVVANLWIETDILPAFLEFPFKWYSEDEGEEEWRAFYEDQNKKSGEWRQTVEKVKAKVAKLDIPGSLKKRMTQIVKAIGTDILEWKTLNGKMLTDHNEDMNIHILGQLRWTGRGAIDYQKTAERLVCLDALNIAKRYKLAFLYCLANFIPVLWKELPEEYKNHFQDKRGSSLVRDMLLEY